MTAPSNPAARRSGHPGIPWLIAVLAVLLGPGALLLGSASPDVSWLLYAAGRMLDGARLGGDILEVSPPIILWMSMPVAALARAIGLAPWALWVVLMTLVAAASAVVSLRLLRPSLEALDRAWPRALLLAVLLLAPGAGFGQREHLSVLLVLPLVALTARRLGGRPIGWRAAVAVGLVGGLGATIKPHFLLVPLALWLLVWWRLRPTWRAPEWFAVAGAALAHAVAVAVLVPTWIDLARTWGPLYLAYQQDRWWAVAFTGPNAAIFWLAVLGAVALWRFTSGPARSVAWALGTASGAYFGAMLAQGKGWEYHYLPAVLMASLLLLLMVAATPATLPWVRRLYRAAAAAAPLALVLVHGWTGALALIGRGEGPVMRVPESDALAAAVRDASGGRPLRIGAISPNIATGFPLVAEVGGEWTGRWSAQWQFTALHAESLEGSGPVLVHAPQNRRGLERAFLDQVHAELADARPGLILVLLPSRNTKGWSGGQRFDYLAYLGAEPRFAAALDQYDVVAIAGPHAVLGRRAEGALPGRPWRTLIAAIGGSAGRPAGAQLPDEPIVPALVLLLMGACWRHLPAGGFVRRGQFDQPET